jgi:hypothetical protein
MADPVTPPASRIRAALGILDISRQALDLDVDTRVATLERERAAEVARSGRK